MSEPKTKPKTKFRGIFPALVTPYTKSGDINESTLRMLVTRCLGQGVSGFYVCGSTAEAFMLSLEERKRILEIVTDENKGRGTIIAHVGSISTDQSIELALHAKSMGVDAISSVPPFYYSFTVDEVIHHYLAIVEAVDLPMILYNFPAYAGFTLTPDLIRRLREASPRIIGLKQTSMNLFELERIMRMDKDFVVLFGHDEVLLGALALGVQGAIGSTYNLMPERYVAMMEAAKNGDLATARQLQRDVNRFIDLMSGTGIPQLKVALELLGFECNGCRKPLRDISAEQKQTIVQILREIGIG